jgi:hypothetical protein
MAHASGEVMCTKGISPLDLIEAALGAWTDLRGIGGELVIVVGRNRVGGYAQALLVQDPKVAVGVNHPGLRCPPQPHDALDHQLARPLLASFI